MTDLIKNLSDLPLRELIHLLRDSGGDIKEIIKQKIRDIISSEKYLISLSKEETTSLRRITQTPIYKRMERCLLGHWSMNLIALGLYVAELNQLNQGKDIQERVRSAVHEKYRARGIRILDIGSTGVIENVLNYLDNINLRKNYNVLEMGRLFDAILDEWENITLFIKSGESPNNIEIKIGDMIANKKKLFFVFACGSAIGPTINTIAKMNIQGLLKGYLFEGKNNPLDNSYSCPFEDTRNFGVDMFS